MKRSTMIALGAAAALVLAGSVVGPELWDYHRFEQALDEHVAEAGHKPASALQERCAGCHGPRGQSLNRLYPALAGQPAAYIQAQLRAFASDQRHSPTMAPLARNLNDEQIALVADFYASQTAGAGEGAPADATLEERGRAAVQSRGCHACHGETLAGKDSAPLLAGQGEDYLANQLLAFKAGDRRDAGGVMLGVATTLSDEDIAAAARYLSRLTSVRRH